MKKTLIAIAICLFAFGGSAMAQKNVKLGHINSQELMQIMPGRDSVQTVLQKEVADLEDQLKMMQSEAENYLSGLQQNIQNELNQSNMQLMDSINNFMKDYAKAKGFDMVLRKSAALYIDPKYDITDEVIEGLNKRYVKVKK